MLPLFPAVVGELAGQDFIALAFLVSAKMIELGLADDNLIDELMELTAQSLACLEIQERFDIVKEIGRGKYGKVLLVTHRFRGATANEKHGLRCFLIVHLLSHCLKCKLIVFCGNFQFLLYF